MPQAPMPGTMTPQEQADALRAQGIPEEVIQQLLGLAEHDPSGLARQYDQSAFLRRAATSGDYAKSAPGVVAQGLAGLLVNRSDKDYSEALRNYQGKATKARRSFFDTRYPRKQITGLPDEEVYE
jgi:hypothetical protein